MSYHRWNYFFVSDEYSNVPKFYVCEEDAHESDSEGVFGNAELIAFFDVRSDYWGDRIHVLFRKLDDDFGLFFLDADYVQWGSSRKELTENSLVFDGKLQITTINNIDNFINACYQLSEETLDNIFEFREPIKPIIDGAKAASVILDVENYFENYGNKNFWVDRTDFDNPLDFLRAIFLIRKLLSYAHENNQFLIYKTYCE